MCPRLTAVSAKQPVDVLGFLWSLRRYALIGLAVLLIASGVGMYLTRDGGSPLSSRASSMMVGLPVQAAADEAEATQLVSFYQWAMVGAAKVGATERVLGPAASALDDGTNAQALLDSMTIEFVPSTTLIRFSYSGPGDFEYAGLVLDVVMDSFAANALPGVDAGAAFAGELSFTVASPPSDLTGPDDALDVSKTSKSTVQRLAIVGGAAVVLAFASMVALDLLRGRRKSSSV